MVSPPPVSQAKGASRQSVILQIPRNLQLWPADRLFGILQAPKAPWLANADSGSGADTPGGGVGIIHAAFTPAEGC